MPSLTSHAESEGRVHFIVRLDVPIRSISEVSESQKAFQCKAQEFHGFITASVHQVPTDQEDTTGLAGVYTFDCAENLVRWLESDERRNLMRAFDKKYGDDVRVDYPVDLAGFQAWLSAPTAKITAGHPIPRWKMNLIVLAVLYPLVLALAAWIPRLIPTATKPTLQLATATVAVIAMGFIFVPAMGSIMKRWLTARKLVGHSIGAIILLAFIYLSWRAAHWEWFHH